MYKDLTKTEKRRVRDAVYRLRKAGFIIDKAAYDLLKATSTTANTQTYGQIEKRVTSLPSVKFSVKYGKGGEIPGSVGYKALLAVRQRNIERTRIHKGNEVYVTAPKAKLSSIGRYTTDFDLPVTATKTDIEKAQVKKFEEMINKLKVPVAQLQSQKRQVAIDNLEKSFNILLQNLPGLKSMIMNKISNMSTEQLSDWMERHNRLLEAAVFSYSSDDEVLSYGGPNSEAYIYSILRVLQINPDEEQAEIKGFENLREEIDTFMKGGHHL